MIIDCPNCNKQFKIDERLIPENGRLLQCSNCKHKWHFLITKVNESNQNFTNLKKNESTNNNDIKEKLINPSLVDTDNNEDREKIIIKKTKNLEKKIKDNNLKKRIFNKKYSSENILNNLIIFIISIFALILILDTFKYFIADYVPILIPLLNNLYETFSDMQFFIKDLVR